MVDARPLRIVYFGTPAFAVPTLERLIESRHPVVAVVSQPDRPRGRGHRVQPTPTKAVASAHDIPVLQPERMKDPELVAQLERLQPDLGVVAAYGRIIPDQLLAIPRFGMINVHGSILPAYRGAAPVHRAVMSGDAATGVTIMRVIRELDAGPTFAMRHRPIGADETSVEVERALADLGAALLVEVVDRIADGSAVETPQDDSRATFAPKLTKAEGLIDWTRPAHVIHNLVRGLQPWPLASTRVGDLRVLLHRTAMDGGSASVPPGTVVTAGADGIAVAGGGGSTLRILQLQPEGRRTMTAREFLAGHKIEPGTRFESP